MRHQCRHGHGLKHAARDTTQYALVQARMAVTTHDDQIEIDIGRNGQDRRLDIRTIGVHVQDVRGQFLAGQMSLQGGGGHIRRYFLLIDADDGDGFRGAEKRSGVACSASRTASTVASREASGFGPKVRSSPVSSGLNPTHVRSQEMARRVRAGGLSA